MIVDYDSLVFGVVHYATTDLSQYPDRMVGVLNLLQSFFEKRQHALQGMYTGTDRWSRRIKMSPSALHQLQVDLTGNLFSNVVVYIGERRAEAVVVSFDATPLKAGVGLSWSLRLLAQAKDIGNPDKAEALSTALWDALSPACGISVFGEDWKDVNAELTTIPYTMWGITTDPHNEQRLLRLQRLRPWFGEYARDAGWGNFLDARLVQRLGGIDHIRTRAPAFAIRPLSGNAAYIRLTEEPAVLHTEGYRSLTSRLSAFLAPVLAPGLNESTS